MLTWNSSCHIVKSIPDTFRAMISLFNVKSPCRFSWFYTGNILSFAIAFFGKCLRAEHRWRKNGKNIYFLERAHLSSPTINAAFKCSEERGFFQASENNMDQTGANKHKWNKGNQIRNVLRFLDLGKKVGEIRDQFLKAAYSSINIAPCICNSERVNDCFINTQIFYTHDYRIHNIIYNFSLLQYKNVHTTRPWLRLSWSVLEIPKKMQRNDVRERKTIREENIFAVCSDTALFFTSYFKHIC